MKSWSLVVSALLGAIATPLAACGADPSLSVLEERAFQQAAAVADAAVVRIETIGGADVVGEMIVASGPTTGVIVDPAGWIITSSFNFVANPASIFVITADGMRYPATLVGRDEARHTTLLKIEASGLKTLTPVPRAEIRVGQWAIALGRTFDPSFPNISVGIVSALNRISGKALQTDAKVSPVNYGGPLVDIEGRCFGILVPMSPQGEGVTAGVDLYDSGIGFAVPLTDVLAVLDRLKSGATLKAGKLGILFTDQPFAIGPIKVDGVRRRSPAEKAGIKAGDSIVGAEGRDVDRVAVMRQILGPRYGGDRVTLKIRRGDQTLDVPVELVDEIPPVEAGYAGVLFERTGKKPLDEAAKVRHVFAGSPAETAGIKPGDVISKVNNVAVGTLLEALVQLRRLGPGDKAALELTAGEQTRPIELTAASLPDKVPSDVPPQHIPSPADGAKPTAKTGRFVDQIVGDERRYWAYVPENFNPEHSYGLIVWLHPTGEEREASVLERFRSICDERGLIVVGPPASKEGWNPSDVAYLMAVISKLAQEYNVNPARMVLFGEGVGGRLAVFLGQQIPGAFGGMVALGTPVSIKSPDAEVRTPLYVAAFADDPQTRKIERSLEPLREQKYPLLYRSLPGAGADGPTDELAQELGRWIDTLDGF